MPSLGQPVIAGLAAAPGPENSRTAAILHVTCNDIGNLRYTAGEVNKWNRIMVDTTILSLAAEIVSAHVSNNAVASDQLPNLINDVHRALSTVGQAGAETPKIEPAVSVKKSVFADHVVCLECGKHFSMLKRHLMTDHKLTVQQYREKWELPSSYPMVSPDYAKVRSGLAKKNGLGRKAAAPKKAGRMAAKDGAKR